jgi:hypothetical protein
MTLLKNLQKNVKSHHFIALIGILVLAFAIMQYTNRKTNYADGFEHGNSDSPSEMHGSSNPSGSVGTAIPATEHIGQNEIYSDVPVNANTNTHGLPPVAQRNDYDPSELLPKDVNSQWAQLNPAGNSNFSNVNLLKAGAHHGIDTVGNSLRNANLQERSEPPNPMTSVGPWGNSTIEPDNMRRTLEIGSN